MELLKEIWRTSKRNRLRISLTGFAVAWGIYMLVVLLGAGNGIINAQKKQSERFLSNSVRVYGRQTSLPYKGHKEGRSIKFNAKDIKITDTLFQNYIEQVGAYLSVYPVTVSCDGNYLLKQTLQGVYPVEIIINKRDMLYGRYINETDMRERRRVVVLSETGVKQLTNNIKTIVGRQIVIDNLSYQVVGVASDLQQQQNVEVITPYTTLKTIYGKGTDVGNIVFTLKNILGKEENEVFEKEYKTRINTNHEASPDDNQTVWLWNRQKDNIQMAEGMKIIENAMWIVGLLTLLGGVVGVSNIMLITVKERTREFGIRKAIGAKPRQILYLIIVESVIITSFFGYIGMFLGIVTNEIMNATLGKATMDTGVFEISMFHNPTVGLDVCIKSILVIVVAGTVAGLIPAIKAARVRPIEALRG